MERAQHIIRNIVRDHDIVLRKRNMQAVAIERVSSSSKDRKCQLTANGLLRYNTHGGAFLVPAFRRRDRKTRLKGLASYLRSDCTSCALF